jgi:hypothetical protein
MADSMAWKTTARDFPVGDYIEAIRKLQARGYSYADIALFLNEKLAAMLGQRKITRGQVYRVYQQWLERQDVLYSTTHISDEDAEVKAELSDKNAKPKPKDTP